jgi:hypothetical protein
MPINNLKYNSKYNSKSFVRYQACNTNIDWEETSAKNVRYA